MQTAFLVLPGSAGEGSHAYWLFSFYPFNVTPNPIFTYKERKGKEKIMEMKTKGACFLKVSHRYIHSLYSCF